MVKANYKKKQQQKKKIRKNTKKMRESPLVSKKWILQKGIISFDQLYLIALKVILKKSLVLVWHWTYAK